AAPPSHPMAPQPGPGGAPGAGGGGRSNTPVIVGAIVVALLAVGGVIAAVLSQGDDTVTPQADRGSASPSVSTSQAAPVSGVGGFKGPDRTKTIEAKECTEARKSFKDESKLRVPNFQYKHIDSVKECLQKAGWKYREIQKNENLWGQGAVLSHTYDDYDEPFDPKTDTIELTVSTGKPE
ncbi:serine/threonine protein kinase, partial [Streptomyces sp. URMC 123]